MTVRFLLLGSLFAAVIGCGGDARPKTLPVSGSVLVNGRPMGGVTLAFHPSDQAGNRVPATAKTREDGTYTLSSFLPDDGAPPGEYVVTAIWPERFVNEGGQENPIGDRFQGAYSNKSTSGLSITVRAGEPTLPPIKLSTKR